MCQFHDEYAINEIQNFVKNYRRPLKFLGANLRTFFYSLKFELYEMGNPW